jgi:tetratricopeptide (TPR) repeat protein
MKLKVMLSVLLVIFSLALFSQTARHQFINFDDPGYVLKNPVVRNGLTFSGVVWAFTSTAMSNWHPVTWLSHMLDVQMFGLDPTGHHLTSVLLHAIAALLLFLFLEGITGFLWRSFIVALLFAVHPLHVESVAWVAERKDVLSCIFWSLTLIFYAAYVKKPGASFYILSLLMFFLGLMSKPMLVTIPVIMLLLDYWPLNRFPSKVPYPLEGEAQGGGEVADGQTRLHAPEILLLLKEKIPFFLLSVLSAIVTIYGQHKGGAMATLVKVPVAARIENALISYIKYIALMFWPHDLAILYPFPKDISFWQAGGSAILLALITFAVIRYRTKFPYLVTGWFWYLVALIPVIGLVQVGGQALADRYTYIPYTGLFIILCWLLPDLMGKWRYRTVALGALSVAAILISSIITWRQVTYWKDDISLYRHTLAVTTDNYLILNNYGIALDQRGDLTGAYGMFQETIRVNPRSAMAYNNLGALYVRWGNFADAANCYSRALEISPNYPFARSGLGKALAGMGRVDEAIWQYEQALSLDTTLAETQLNLAILLMKKGDSEKGMTHYSIALQLNPTSAKAPINMGTELASQGRLAEALEYFNHALSLEPDSVEAHFNRGVTLAKMGRKEEAREEFARVLQIMPESVGAKQWLEKLGP